MWVRRKSFRLLAIAVATIAIVAAACDRPRPPPPAAAAPSATVSAPPPAPAPTPLAAAPATRLAFVEHTTAGAPSDATLPLLVAIHGMGDSPDGLAPLFDGLPVRARVLLPRAPLPFHRGFSWFRYPPASDDELARGVADAADAVAALIDEIARGRPTRGVPIVTGFSQGGFLSFAIAVRHPALVGAAFPVSGSLPPSLWPAAVPDAAPLPPLLALHGDADGLVPIAGARAAVAHLRAIGWPATLEEYPGVGHTIAPPMRKELVARLAERLARE